MSDTYTIPVPHPGTFINEEIEARGWNQRDLAYILGVSERTVSQIVSGKGGISANMAKALALAFDVSPDLFLSLQSQHDLWVAREPEVAVKTRATVLASYPLREMMRRGWIVSEADPAKMERSLCQFFGVDSIDRVPHLRHAARKAEKSYYDEIPAPQIAWLFRVRQIAGEMVVPPYSAAKLKRAVESMGTMRRSPEETRRVPRLLQDAGVRFLIVEGLTGGKIDGVCFWIGDQPVIGMTTRYDRIDNFWFVLRHEIEHVLRGDGRTREIIDTEDEIDAPDDADLPAQEKRANTAAADFCVPIRMMDSFYRRQHPYFSRVDVIGFAERIGVHPGLVVGQLHRRTKRYQVLREFLIAVREYLLGSATVDGWGEVIPMGL